MVDSKATTPSPSLPTRSKDNLIPGQETSRNKLSLFETNWKKDGPNKRSTREFVEREQKALNDLWQMELQKEALAQILAEA